MKKKTPRRRPTKRAAPPKSTAKPRALPTAKRPAEQIAATIAEAARCLGVSARVFAGWMTDPSFPGRPGERGKQNGHFPIDAIRTWHLAAHGPRAKSSERDEQTAALRLLKAQIDCDRDQVALEKEIGSIGDAEDFAALARRIIAAAKAQLEELGDRTMTRLPAKLPGEAKRTLRKAIEQTVAEVLNTLAELIAGDLDEAEDVPDDEP